VTGQAWRRLAPHPETLASSLRLAGPGRLGLTRLLNHTMFPTQRGAIETRQQQHFGRHALRPSRVSLAVPNPYTFLTFFLCGPNRVCDNLYKNLAALVIQAGEASPIVSFSNLLRFQPGCR
jgi:hypothetical protein